MPQLGETVTEGTITRWMKAVGDQIARDEPLFEVSTDKVDSEVPSPVEGVLTAILVEEGDTVDVGVTLAIIGDGATANGAGPVETATAPEAGIAPAPPPPAPAPPPPTVAPPPVVPPAPAAPAPPEVVGAAPPSPLANGTGEGLVLSPVVRRLLHEHDIDPGRIKGTGLGGRITRSDVESVIAERLSDGTTGPILGVHMVGPWVTEQLGAGYLAVNWEATADEVAHFIQPHPSLSETFGETVQALTGRGLHVA